MGLIRKAASIFTLGGVSDPSGRGSRAARARAKAAKAGAGLAEAEAKVAQQQAAAIARALHEDEAHRHADLEEVAEEEAEAVPWSRLPAAASKRRTAGSGTRADQPPRQGEPGRPPGWP